MLTATLAAVAAALLALAVFAVRRPDTPAAPRALIATLCVTVAYDDAVIAAGRAIGTGDTLLALNAARFWLHSLVTPLAVAAAAALAASLGVAVLARTPGRIAVGVVVTGLIALGMATEASRLDLRTQSEAGTLRYVSERGGPPLAAIATVIAVIAIGAAVWRRAGIPWLLVGAVVMFAAAAAGATRFWIGNLGELVLQAAFVATLAAANRTGVRVVRQPEAAEEAG
ncbi:hypothetical protein AB0M47_32955 [Hamadaea sp. NPDC051192]|uniref:hypothetical protein n=1 Tax=Hamadaea sp. NPDC051192 TaxID=3154940 RepID=UPI00344931B2